MVYNKPALTVAQQLTQLRKRGLRIPDPQLADHFLRNVSYYRLAGYWWTLQSDFKRHRFRRGASFNQVVDRYNFDRELRLIVLDMVERIEIAVRTRMIYHLSLAYNPYWIENVNLVKNTNDWAYNIKKIKADTRRSSEIYLRKHYKDYSTDSRCPPSWKSLEIVTMGTISKMYTNLKPTLPEKDLIAQELGLPDQTFLENWLHGVAIIRNIVAHHNRLFQGTISVKPILPASPTGNWITTKGIGRHSVYLHLSCMAYLLQFISPGNRFSQRLADLFTKYKATVKYKEIGFPANWCNQPLWKQ
jgi:abortive infection bacteriophage resistance protein